MQTFYPSPALRPFVQSFLIIESPEGSSNHILPGLSVMLALCCSGHVSYRDVMAGENQVLPQAVVSGLRKSARIMQYAPGTTNLLVQFTPGGAAAVLQQPMQELFNETLPLDVLLPARQLQQVQEQLALAGNTRQRIAIAEQFITARLRHAATHPVVQHAVQLITAAAGDISIKTLISSLPMSRDVFEKKFRHNIGTSPKQFAGIVRLRHLIAHHNKTESLTSTALSAGYYDQAHFIKDFRTFTGKAPKAFFSDPVYW